LDTQRDLSVSHLRVEIDVRFGSWSCKNALAVALTPRAVGDVAVRGNSFGVWPFLSGDTSDQDFSRPGAGLQQQTHAFRRDHALTAAISGLVPMMFMTRVIL
jgi:hypothetical protein